MIIDTCFVIDVMRNNKKAIDKLNELLNINEELFITSISIFELFSGIQKSNQHKDELKKVMDVLNDLMSLSFTINAAQKAGNIDSVLVNQGIMNDPIDNMIAGIALINKQAILTKNIKHFEKIHDLKIETY